MLIGGRFHSDCVVEPRFKYDLVGTFQGNFPVLSLDGEQNSYGGIVLFLEHR